MRPKGATRSTDRVVWEDSGMGSTVPGGAPPRPRQGRDTRNERRRCQLGVQTATALAAEV
jgi:hypothetical protein